MVIIIVHDNNKYNDNINNDNKNIKNKQTNKQTHRNSQCRAPSNPRDNRLNKTLQNPKMKKKGRQERDMRNLPNGRSLPATQNRQRKTGIRETCE